MLEFPRGGARAAKGVVVAVAGDRVGSELVRGRPRQRSQRRDTGVRAPEKRRSDEHYARMLAAAFRSKRTTVLVRLAGSAPALTEEQYAEVLRAVRAIPVLDGDSEGTEGAGAA